MKTYKILLPLDGSHFSRRVIPYVCRMFNPQNYELVLIRVGNEPRGVPIMATQPIFVAGNFLSEIRTPTMEEAAEHQIYTSQIWETTAASLADELHTDANELKQTGFAVRIEARCGDPAEEICTYAKEHAVDFVLMATHGRTGLRRLALGSVAAEVLRNTSVPVMLIPPGEGEQQVDPVDLRNN